MLNNPVYYFGLLRKYQVVFGSLFNDIVFNRMDANNNASQIINVPIEYAQKEKMLTRVTGDPNIDRPEEITLPTMAWFMTGYHYDASRMNSQIRKYVLTEEDSNITYVYSGAPWNFDFDLYIYVKNTEDANKIVEQILPFFTPAWTATVFLLPNMQSIDLPIELKSVSHENMDTENFKDNPFLVWTLSFTLKGFLWGPVRNANTINTIDIQYYAGEAPVSNAFANLNAFGISGKIYPNSSNGATLAFTQVYTPGLTSNGQPTSNAEDSVNIQTIDWTEDWGLAEVSNDVGGED